MDGSSPPPYTHVRLDMEESIRRKREWTRRIDALPEFWVFGYGSLMWKPGFAYLECRPAHVRGVKRAFCVWSHRYRGTPEKPGLVLGLARRDGECAGRVFRVDDQDRAQVIEYLWEREMVTGVYEPEILEAVTPSGPVQAHAFVVDGSHRQFAGALCDDDCARLIAAAEGAMGPNRDYLFNTVSHLQEIGLSDPDLAALADRVRALLPGGDRP